MNLQIVDKIDDNSFPDLCDLFRNEWWSNNRKPAEIKKLIENTDLIVGIVDKDTGKLIAFSRVLTDFMYRSMIYDVIVDKSYRNKGIGSKLINAIIEHPSLKNVEFVELQTQPDLVSFYEQFGFDKEIVGKMKTLRIISKK
jgi:ribosomal protein S18 acetylase RimI-like enzyme